MRTRTLPLRPLFSILFVTLLAAAPAFAAPIPVRPAPTMVQVDQRELLAELQALQRQVQALQAQAKSRRSGKELRRGLDSMSSRLSHLERSLRMSHPIAAVAPRPQVQARPSFNARH